MNKRGKPSKPSKPSKRSKPGTSPKTGKTKGEVTGHPAHTGMWDLETALPKLKVHWTRRGSWCLRFTLLFLVLGAATQNSPLILITLVFLLALPMAWLLCRINLSGVRYTCLVPQRPFAQEEFTARMQLWSKGRILPRYTIAVDDSLLSTKAANWLVPIISAGEEIEERRSSRLLYRGAIDSSEVSLRSNFPFGFFEARRKWTVPQAIVVYPAPLTPETPNNHSEDRQRDPQAARFTLPTDAGEFRSVREFRSGDRMRSIHWTASLRYDQLVVREFDPPLVDAYSFVFHSFSPKGTMQKPKSFERCMQLLCGFFLQCKERGMPFDFTASFNKYETVEVRDPSDIATVLELIARAIDRPERDPDRLVSRIRRQAEQRRCFVVSNIPIAQWAHLLDELPMEIHCVDAKTWRTTGNRNATDKTERTKLGGET